MTNTESAQAGQPRKGAIIWAVVSLGLGALGLGIGALKYGVDESTSPIIVTILTVLSATLPSILALLKVDNVQAKMENGAMTAKVAEAIRDTVHPNLLNNADSTGRAADIERGPDDGRSAL
jgi:hypothetical protein